MTPRTMSPEREATVTTTPGSVTNSIAQSVSPPPLLTVLLIAGNVRERAQRTLRSILDQDIASQIVVMFYDRAQRPARDLPELNLPNVVYEVVDPRSNLGLLQKRAVFATSTEVIAFIEEHVLVPPGWARESLRLHAEGYAGVSGIFTAGNPRYRFSRILFSITYGSYMVSEQGGATIDIPGDNSSFIRSRIAKFEHELEPLLDSDTLLIRRLSAGGESLYRAANLTLTHWNENVFFDGWRALFLWNQMYICNCLTVDDWSLSRRVLRFLATPLVPFARALKSYRRARVNRADMKQFFAELPVSFLYHVASALGMAAGLLFGYLDSRRKFADCETNARRDD